MKKILVVDDAIDIVSSLVDLLEEVNYRVFYSYNAESALKMAKEIIPDLILCDIFMPEMDGYQLIREIRNFPPTSEIPIIILSAGVDKVDIEKGRCAPVNKFIVKPYNTLELLGIIKDIFSN